MTGKPVSLPDYVRDVIREKKVSLREVARKGGKGVSHATISDIMNGKRPNPGASTLKALAKGLDVPESELLAAVTGAGVETNEVEQELAKLRNYFVDLPRECQKDVVALTESLWMRRRIEAKAERLANIRAEAEAKRPAIEAPTVKTKEAEEQDNSKPHTSKRRRA